MKPSGHVQKKLIKKIKAPLFEHCLEVTMEGIAKRRYFFSITVRETLNQIFRNN